MYTRPDVDIEMGEASPSTRYLDFFRTQSQNGSSSNSDDYIDPLEAELDLIPPTTAPPPQCKFGRFVSDSFKSSSSCKQKTKIVVFENEDVFDSDEIIVHLTDKPGQIGRRRCARHLSVCVGEVQNGVKDQAVFCNSLGDEHLKQLFIDTRLANQGIVHEMQAEATTSSYTNQGTPLKVSCKGTLYDTEYCGVNRLRGEMTTSVCRAPGLLKSHYSVDSGLDSPISNCALLFKEDLPKELVEDPTVTVASTSSGNRSVFEINKIILESRDNVYALFMKAHHCFDLIPLSVKITAISSDLPILKAFCAYVYNGVRASPLYFSDIEGFNGMVTASDFIQIMTKLYREGPVSEVLKDLEGFTLNDWRSMLDANGYKAKPFVFVDPQDSLFKAVQEMYNNHIHRLALVDKTNGNVEFIVSYKRLLKFVFIYIKDLPFPSYMCRKPKELGIGEWNNIITVSLNSKIIDLFHVFVDSKKCFVPIVDENSRLVNCCSKVDVIRYNIYHCLGAPIQNALNDPARNFHGVYTCTEDDCLMTVLEKMSKYDVHRLVVVDDEARVIGLISLTDIFRFLVLEPPLTSGPRVINRQELTTKITIEDSD